MSTFQPKLPPNEIAAMIEREELAWQFHVGDEIWVRDNNYLTVFERVALGQEIRLAPGALTEFGLKPGMVPRNPDNLTADQITEGGKYRAWSEDEYKFATSSFKGHLQKLIAGEWTQGACGDSASGTYRVPIDAPYQTPLPNVN